MAFRLARLRQDAKLVDANGAATRTFVQWWQSVVTKIEDAVNDLVDVLVRLGLVEVAADGALELAESAIEPGGAIKDNKVATEALQAGAVSQIEVFYNASLGTISGSLSTWIDTVITVTVDATGTDQGVLIDLVAQLTRSGGTDDTISFRIMRGDATTLPQSYQGCKIEGGQRPYGFKFVDASPVAGENDYTLQILSTDDWPSWADTVLTGALFKK